MFCNFCYNAGRADFNTHYTRNRHGKLTCKYLSNMVCLKCGINGHTIKYCRTKLHVKSIRSSDDWATVKSSSSGIKKISRTSPLNSYLSDAKISNILTHSFTALDIESVEDVDGSDYGIQPAVLVIQNKSDEVDGVDRVDGVDGVDRVDGVDGVDRVDGATILGNIQSRRWSDMVDDDDM